MKRARIEASAISTYLAISFRSRPEARSAPVESSRRSFGRAPAPAWSPRAIRRSDDRTVRARDACERVPDDARVSPRSARSKSPERNPALARAISAREHHCRQPQPRKPPTICSVKRLDFSIEFTYNVDARCPTTNATCDASCARSTETSTFLPSFD